MKNIVVYWSQTGNTEALANKIASDLACDAISVDSANLDSVASADTIILGCPAMGAEEIEDSEFRPFFESIASQASSKKYALFGSYGWGTGEWMDSWKDEAIGLGLNVVATLICNEGIENLDDSDYNNFVAALN